MTLPCPDFHANVSNRVGFTTTNRRLASNNCSAFSLIENEGEENHGEYGPVASCGPLRASTQPPGCASGSSVFHG